MHVSLSSLCFKFQFSQCSNRLTTDRLQANDMVMQWLDVRGSEYPTYMAACGDKRPAFTDEGVDFSGGDKVQIMSICHRAGQAFPGQAFVMTVCLSAVDSPR